MYEKNRNSTVSSFDTPHGYHVPHKFPSKTSDEEDLMKLVGQLYPTGRAWYLPEKGVFGKLHESLNVSFLRFLEHSYSLINSSFPDNDNFSLEDCELWEYKLGLNSNTSLTIEQRRVNILNKMSYPRNINLRQAPKFIEKVLNDFGFKVGVYENIFFDNVNNVYFRKLPSEIQSLQIANTQHSNDLQHGNSIQHGGGNFEVIANSIENESYSFGGNENLWATFFIAAKNDITQKANIPLSRKKEFKELVLKLKPAHTIAFIFINF